LRNEECIIVWSMSDIEQGEEAEQIKNKKSK
jgi:hypothetical protein